MKRPKIPMKYSSKRRFLFLKKEDFYSFGHHDCSSASKDLIYDFYNALEPTIHSNYSKEDIEIIKKILAHREKHKKRMQFFGRINETNINIVHEYTKIKESLIQWEPISGEIFKTFQEFYKKHDDLFSEEHSLKLYKELTRKISTQELYYRLQYEKKHDRKFEKFFELMLIRYYTKEFNNEQPFHRWFFETSTRLEMRKK